MSVRPDLDELDARIAVAYADGIPLEDTPTVLEDVAKAADEVLRHARALEAERDRYRAALEKIVAKTPAYDRVTVRGFERETVDTIDAFDTGLHRGKYAIGQLARKALEGGEE